MYNLVVIPVEYFESSEIWNQWKIENKEKRQSFFAEKILYQTLCLQWAGYNFWEA